jgi:hypothetical protein
MPRNCTACVHEQSAQITKDIAAGVSYRSISSQYGITVSAGQRHAVKLLTPGALRGIRGQTATSNTAKTCASSPACEVGKFVA